MGGLGPCPCAPCGACLQTSPLLGHLAEPAQKSPAHAAGLKLAGWHDCHLVWVAVGAGPPANCPVLAQISEALLGVVVGACQSPEAGWRHLSLALQWELGLWVPPAAESLAHFSAAAVASLAGLVGSRQEPGLCPAACFELAVLRMRAETGVGSCDLASDPDPAAACHCALTACRPAALTLVHAPLGRVPVGQGLAAHGPAPASAPLAQAESKQALPAEPVET